MSARLLRREAGAVLSCNGDKCTERVHTAQVRKKLIRSYASTLGWRRGHSTTDGGAGKRADLCPGCATAEAERVAVFVADKERTKAERRAAKEAKLAPLRGAPALEAVP